MGRGLNNMTDLGFAGRIARAFINSKLTPLIVAASLLLGLYDEDGRLDHVGFTSAIPSAERPALTKQLESLIQPPGFTGSAPGGPSRWNTARSMAWEPLKPVLVAEVRYDQVTSRRFRHGTGFLRWRPDKDPEQCTFEQLAPELRPSQLKELFAR